MSNDTVVSLAAPARVSDPSTGLLRTGARRLVEAAVSAEFDEYLSAFVQEQLPDGRQRVVRNGHGDLPAGELVERIEKVLRRTSPPDSSVTRTASILRACASSRTRLRTSRLFLVPDAVSLKLPSTSKPPRSAKAVSSATVRASARRPLTSMKRRLPVAGCCLPLCLVGSPRDLAGLFRRRFAWDGGAIRAASSRDEVAFVMNDCC